MKKQYNSSGMYQNEKRNEHPQICSSSILSCNFLNHVYSNLEFLSRSLMYKKSETHKKILHNKYQMFNKNSFLWKKLKLQFTKYMDEILEL